MAHSLVSLREDGKASILGNDDLVPILDIVAHELAIKNKELGSILHELSKLGLQKINWGQGFGQDGLDDFELVVRKLGLLGTGNLWRCGERHIPSMEISRTSG